MVKHICILLLLCALSIGLVYADGVSIVSVVYVTADPSGSCTNLYITVNKTSGGVSTCKAGTWNLLPGSSSGLTSLNTLSAATQTFVNDTNVTVVSAGSTHTLTWAGTLAKNRLLATVVYNDQSNTYSTGTQNFAAATHFVNINGTAAAKPATCTRGESYFATDATAGQNMYYCTATDTWTQQLGGASSTGTSIQKGNGSGGFSAALAADVVSLFSTCSGTQYLGADGVCHTAAGSGTVTHTGNLTATQAVIGNGTADVKTAPVVIGAGSSFADVESLSAVQGVGKVFDGEYRATAVNNSASPTSKDAGAFGIEGTYTDGAVLTLDLYLYDYLNSAYRAIFNSDATWGIGGAADSTPDISGDGSGNVAVKTSVSVGQGGTDAGKLGLKQGSLPSSVANTVSFVAPTSVDAGGVLNKVVGTAGSGFYYGTNSSGTVTWSQVGAEGNGSKVQLFTGSDPATNDCAKFDVNHNLVSAGAACSSGGGTGDAASVVTAPFGSSVTFTCPSSTAGTVTLFQLSTTLTTNVTSSSLNSCTNGQTLIFSFTQDGTGGRTVTAPAGLDPFPVDPTLSVVTTMVYSWNGTVGHLISAGSTDTPSKITLTERAAPGTPAASLAFCWPDSTDHSGLECKANNSANIFKLVLTGVDIVPTTGQVTATHLAAALPLAQGGTALGAVPGSSGNFVYNNSGAYGAKALGVGDMPNVNVLISTSGAVADPGNSADYQFNNAVGALTFNLPAGVAGLERCFRQATGKSGVITIKAPTSNTIDLDGANGSSAGTLVSAGAVGEAVCLVSDATNHWYAYVQKGTWLNN